MNVIRCLLHDIENYKMHKDFLYVLLICSHFLAFYSILCFFFAISLNCPNFTTSICSAKMSNDLFIFKTVFQKTVKMFSISSFISLAEILKYFSAGIVQNTDPDITSSRNDNSVV